MREATRWVDAIVAEQAAARKLCSVDKSNVLECSRLWEEVVARIAPEFPEVEVSNLYLVCLSRRLLHSPSTDPTDFDIIVSSNLFGDVLSDLTAGLLGSPDVLPSTSLFEPVHGSAPT